MTVLADTSVWVAHFRHSEPKLAVCLSDGVVVMHPWISGELACGNLKDRRAILAHLGVLPSVKVASDKEALALLEDRKLWGRGLGWVDVHLLASAVLSGCRLWTFDKQLARAANELGIN